MVSKLTPEGRCCGRKPIVYKRPTNHLFCFRCDRAYDSETGEQVSNWAYKLIDGDFVCQKVTDITPRQYGGEQ